jgi:hypothetical protein
LTKVKYRYLGLLLLCTLVSFAVVTLPASAAAPSWVSDGKYATYYGGFKVELGTPGQSGYIKVQFTVNANWSLSNTALTQTKVSGGWNISVLLNFNNTPLFSGGFGSKGNETINLDTGLITLGEGFDFIGMEIPGHHTVLWVDSTASLPPAAISIGGRHAVNVTGSMVIPFIPNATIPITRYYDRDTGMLLGFNLALNITGLGFPAPAWHGSSDIIGLSDTDGVVNVNQIPGLGSLGEIAFPVVVSNTNVFAYAWNPGGDATLWLEAVGVLLGVSVLFGLIVYAKKR